MSLNSCVTGWKVSEEQQQRPDVSIGDFNNLVTGQIITILKQQHWSQSQLEQSSLLWPRLVPLVLQWGHNLSTSTGKVFNPLWVRKAQQVILSSISAAVREQREEVVPVCYWIP